MVRVIKRRTCLSHQTVQFIKVGRSDMGPRSDFSLKFEVPKWLPQFSILCFICLKRSCAIIPSPSLLGLVQHSGWVQVFCRAQVLRCFVLLSDFIHMGSWERWDRLISYKDFAIPSWWGWTNISYSVEKKPESGKERAQNLLLSVACLVGPTPQIPPCHLGRCCLLWNIQVYPLGLGLWLASWIIPCGAIWQGPRNMSDQVKCSTLKLPLMKMTCNLQRLLCWWVSGLYWVQNLSLQQNASWEVLKSESLFFFFLMKIAQICAIRHCFAQIMRLIMVI